MENIRINSNIIKDSKIDIDIAKQILNKYSITLEIVAYYKMNSDWFIIQAVANNVLIKINSRIDYKKRCEIFKTQFYNLMENS